MNLNVRRRIAALTAVGASMAAWLLWRFPPAGSRFYPRCPIYETLHVECPGCGGTRALYALLHGRLADALHFNALMVVLLPFLFAFLAISWIRAIRNAEFHWPTVPGIWIKMTLAAAIAFTVIRNLPHGR